MNREFPTRWTWIILSVILCPLFLSPAPEVHFKGLVQTWFSYGPRNLDTEVSDLYGFSLRRVNLDPYGQLSDTIHWRVKLNFEEDSASFLDAYLLFRLASEFQVQIGKFPVPGARSGGLTSSAALDLVQRPAISRYWSRINGLQSFRSTGIQVQGRVIDNKVSYALMLSDIVSPSPFRPRNTEPEYPVPENNGLTLWGRGEALIMEGMHLGIFYHEGKDSRSQFKRRSFGSSLYYEHRGVKIKCEYISGSHGLTGSMDKYSGGFARAGFRFLSRFEPLFQFGFLNPFGNSPDSRGIETYYHYTLGLNYHHSSSVKLQVNYLLRTEKGGDIHNDLFLLCFQYTFNTGE